MEGWRCSRGARPLGRVEGALRSEGWRCARRYGPGESLAKVAAGKDSGERVGAVEVAIFGIVR